MRVIQRCVLFMIIRGLKRCRGVASHASCCQKVNPGCSKETYKMFFEEMLWKPVLPVCCLCCAQLLVPVCWLVGGGLIFKGRQIELIFKNE